MNRFAPVNAALAAVAAGHAPSLRVSFPTGAVVDIAGKHLAPDDATGEPSVSVAGAAVKQGQKYMLVGLDPDAPFPSLPFLGPILHGIQTDLVPGPVLSVAGPTEETATDYIPLVSDKPPLVPHVKPGPPRISAPHRYVFVLWPQPERVGDEGAIGISIDATIRQKLGWGDGPVARMARMRFDVNAFVAALGLGEVAAVTYFTSSS